MRHVKVQPNKGADNPSLKDLAAKNPHQVVAEAFVPIENMDNKETIREMFDDLRADAAVKDSEKEAKKGGKK